MQSHRFRVTQFRTFCTIGALLLTLSCKNNIDSFLPVTPELVSEIVTVAEAKAYFENQLNPPQMGGRTTANGKKKPIRVPLWDLTVDHRKKNDDNANMLSVPLLQDEKNFSVGGVRKMLVLKDKNNKLKVGVMEAIADKDYLKANNYQLNSQNFSGVILMHDWESGFETGFRLKDGKPVALIQDLAEPDEQPGQKSVKTVAGARPAACVVTVEKCYGTKYFDQITNTWFYSAMECYLERYQYYEDTSCNYWPLWKGFVDFTFTNPSGNQQSDALQTVGYLNGKLTVSFASRPCLHHIVAQIMNYGNPLARLGSILNASGQEYNFYRFVSDLTNASSKFQIYIKEGNFAGTANAQTEYNVTQGIATVTLKSNYLSQATDLSVARTIAHELIHCYLFMGRSDSSIYGSSFDIVQNYLQNQANIVSAQHQLMANEYRQTVVSVLNNFINIENISIPTDPAAINLYLDKMSWGGLLNTNSFTTKSSEEQESIRSVLRSEEQRTSVSSKKSGC